MRCDVLLFAEDPGAAGFLAPVPAALSARGLPTRLLADGLALPYLREQGIAAQPWAGPAAAVLDRHAPRLLVLGTSENPDTPAFALRDEARRRGVRTVGVVDASMGAAERFRGRTGRPLGHAPDALLVPDPATRNAFAALGFPAEAISVVGHPRADVVRAERVRLEAVGREALRVKVFPRAPAGLPVLLFLVETSTGLRREEFRRGPDYTLHGRGAHDGRTEVVLEEVLDAVAALPRRPHVAIRLHPKNRAEDFAAYRGELGEVLPGGPGLEAVFAADAVVGMTTALLGEAALLGRPTLSVLPRAEERTWLGAVRLDWTPCATTRAEVRALLPEVLAGGGVVPRAMADRDLPPGAAARAAAVLEAQLAPVPGRSR